MNEFTAEEINAELAAMKERGLKCPRRRAAIKILVTRSK